MQKNCLDDFHNILARYSSVNIFYDTFFHKNSPKETIHIESSLP